MSNISNEVRTLIKRSRDRADAETKCFDALIDLGDIDEINKVITYINDIFSEATKMLDDA